MKKLLSDLNQDIYFVIKCGYCAWKQTDYVNGITVYTAAGNFVILEGAAISIMYTHVEDFSKSRGIKIVDSTRKVLHTCGEFK